MVLSSYLFSWYKIPAKNIGLKMFYFSYQRADLVLAPIDVAKGEETEQTQEVNGSPRRQHGLAYPEEKGVDVAKRP